jgi:hypothetical protein
MDTSTIQAVTPSEIFSSAGQDVHLTQQSERTGIEQKWFAVTGRVVAVKVEADGDLHIALSDSYCGCCSHGPVGRSSCCERQNGGEPALQIRR